MDKLSAPLVFEIDSRGIALASFSLVDSGSKGRNSISQLLPFLWAILFVMLFLQQHDFFIGNSHKFVQW